MTENGGGFTGLIGTITAVILNLKDTITKYHTVWKEFYIYCPSLSLIKSNFNSKILYLIVNLAASGFKGMVTCLEQDVVVSPLPVWACQMHVTRLEQDETRVESEFFIHHSALARFILNKPSDCGTIVAAMLHTVSPPNNDGIIRI